MLPRTGCKAEPYSWLPSFFFPTLPRSRRAGRPANPCRGHTRLRATRRFCPARCEARGHSRRPLRAACPTDGAVPPVRSTTPPGNIGRRANDRSPSALAFALALVSPPWRRTQSARPARSVRSGGGVPGAVRGMEAKRVRPRAGRCHAVGLLAARAHIERSVALLAQTRTEEALEAANRGGGHRSRECFVTEFRGRLRSRC